MSPNYHCSYGASQRPLIKLLKITFVTWILIHCHKNIEKKFITTDSDEKMLIIFGKSPLNHFVGDISQVIKKNFCPYLIIQFLQIPHFLLSFDTNTMLVT